MIDKHIIHKPTTAMGPRVQQNKHRYLHKAITEQKDDKNRQERHVDDGYNEYESTTTAAQRLAKDRITRPSCLDERFTVHEDSTLCIPDDAVTFWSQQVRGSKLEGTEHIFARCSGFTNDILDGRLIHSEAVDSYKDC